MAKNLSTALGGFDINFPCPMLRKAKRKNVITSIGFRMWWSRL